jgi:hypothetical protein
MHKVSFPALIVLVNNLPVYDPKKKGKGGNVKHVDDISEIPGFVVK